MDTSSVLVIVRGGGDLGTGVAHRLRTAGFRVVVMELPQPTVIRRLVAFASAVYQDEITVEGITARLVAGDRQPLALLSQGIVPVVVDERGDLIAEMGPQVVVDARLAKRNLGTSRNDAPLVIGLGPGFVAGVDVHAVVETNRGHDLGRVLFEGIAEHDTGIPGPVGGFSNERVLRAPCSGTFEAVLEIGANVGPGEVVARVSERPVPAPIQGVLRGVLHSGLCVREGQKVGDIDPRGKAHYCFTISDKARAIGGSVLETILCMRARLAAKELDPVPVKKGDP
jgi:xanthine dehydrogenase accessory factor